MVNRVVDETKKTSEKASETANIDNYIEQFITSVELANRGNSKKPMRKTKRKKTKEIFKQMRYFF